MSLHCMFFPLSSECRRAAVHKRNAQEDNVCMKEKPDPFTSIVIAFSGASTTSVCLPVFIYFLPFVRITAPHRIEYGFVLGAQLCRTLSCKRKYIQVETCTNMHISNVYTHDQHIHTYTSLMTYFLTMQRKYTWFWCTATASTNVFFFPLLLLLNRTNNCFFCRKKGRFFHYRSEKKKRTKHLQAIVQTTDSKQMINFGEHVFATSLLWCHVYSIFSGACFVEHAMHWNDIFYVTTIFVLATNVAHLWGNS